MSEIDFQNGFICGMATKGLVYSKNNPKDPRTRLLLHFDELADSSAYHLPLASCGSPTITAARSRFGGNSLYLDGSSYLQAGTENDFNFGYSDFTVELWINLSTSISAKRCCLFGKYYYDGSTDERYYCLELLNGKINAAAATERGAVNIFHMGTGTLSWSLNQWYHIALVKGAGQLMIFRNGIKQSIAVDKYYVNCDGVSAMPYIPEKKANIGTFSEGSFARAFTGYVDELRVSDKARWTANFTPPTAQYTT